MTKADSYTGAVPIEALSVRCVKAVSNMSALRISVAGTGIRYVLDVPESQLWSGMSGAITCNRVVFMPPGLRQWDIPATEQMYKAEYEGFLCPIHTSPGAAGGCIWMMVSGIRVRVMGGVTLNFLKGASLLIAHPCDCRDTDKDTPFSATICGITIELRECRRGGLLDVYRSTSGSYHTRVANATW